MDRKSFLLCQSFLYLLPPAIVSDPKLCSHEVLLTNTKLSIEPNENSTANVNRSNAKNVSVETLGPAYFLPPRIVSPTTDTTKNNDNADDDGQKSKNGCGDDGNGDSENERNFDPTMCKIELKLHAATLTDSNMTTPVKKSNRRNPSEIVDQAEKASDEAIVIAVIDGNSFQVDLNKIRSISSNQSKKNVSHCDTDSTNETTENFMKEITSCLLLEFPSCYFRIFRSLPSSSSSSNHSLITDNDTVAGNDIDSQNRDDTIMFDLVHKKLESIIILDYVRPFPLSYSGLTASYDQKNNDDDALKCARQCLQSYSKSWNNLFSFSDILEKPVRSEQCSTASADFIRENDFKETINQFMRTIPKQVSSSFIEADQRATALNLYDEEIGKQKDVFDDIIREYWPTTIKTKNSSNKRRRVEQDNNNYDYIGRFAKSLVEHKKLLGSKHELYLLPFRD